jgi:hypothetical protein
MPVSPPKHRAMEFAREEGTVVVARCFEFLSRSLARLAVKVRDVGSVEPRDEYESFVETVAILHDRHALNDLDASDRDEAAGALHELADVRRDLNLGSRHTHKHS